MKKRSLFTGLLLLLTLGTFAVTPVAPDKTHAQKIVEAIHNPKTDYVVVVSHRGDWRDYPENSIPAIESIIRMGVDVCLFYTFPSPRDRTRSRMPSSA